MFELKDVVPWGRSFDEYRRMFALSDEDLAFRILGCADGPASFNAAATRRGFEVVSCDPLYEFSSGEIEARIEATYGQIVEQTRKNMDEFVWDVVGSVEELGRVRMAAMQEFLNDYNGGRKTGRYVTAELPNLPFGDSAFGLALCSHFLFLYSEQLGQEFHARAIRELCRVAREVRIFPLLALGGQRSSYVDEIQRELTTSGKAVSIEGVPYEFQRGGNKMMRIQTKY